MDGIMLLEWDIIPIMKMIGIILMMVREEMQD